MDHNGVEEISAFVWELKSEAKNQQPAEYFFVGGCH